MKFRIQVVCVTDDGAEQTRQVMEFERQELAMETLGMSLLEGKALLQGVQGFCCKNSLTIQDVAISNSISLLQNVAKIFFATEPF
jgi:hypothetical protein